MKLAMNCHNKYLFCKFILLINFAEDIQNMISQRIGFIGASIIYFFLSYNSKFSQYSNLLKPNVVSVIPACYQFVKKLCQLLHICKHRPYFPTFSPNMGKYGPKNSEHGRFPCSASRQRFYTISAKFQLVKNSLIRKSKNYTLLATSSKHVNHDSIRNFVCSKTSYGIITIIS